MRGSLRTLIAAALFTLALQYATHVRGGYSFDTPSAHPDWEPGIEAIQRSDWADAIDV